MPFFVQVVSRLAAFSLVLVGPAAGRPGKTPGQRLRAGPLHQARVQHPDARRREALHVGLRAEGHARQTYPIMLMRTPYSVAPYGVDKYRDDLGPSRALREGRLHRRLPGRARAVHVRGRVRRDAAAQPEQEGAAGHRREHRHLRHDRLAGEERPGQQRQGRHVGHLVSGLLRQRGHDRRASGAGGRLAAGAGHRLVPGRRLVSQRRVPAGAQLRLLHELRAADRRPGAAAVAGQRSTTARPTATSSSCRWGRSRTRTRST